MDEQLKALADANEILVVARCNASYGPMLAWSTLLHASRYINKQMDEMVAPVFAPEAL